MFEFGYYFNVASNFSKVLQSQASPLFFFSLGIPTRLQLNHTSHISQATQKSVHTLGLSLRIFSQKPQ